MTVSAHRGTQPMITALTRRTIRYRWLFVISQMIGAIMASASGWIIRASNR
jgi:glycerol uptake facilitator-like aquaporin